MNSFSRWCSLFALGVAAWAQPLFAANVPAPVRLYEITVTKFLVVDGQNRIQQGRLAASGGFTLVSENATATAVPAALQGKPVIFTEAWFAFASLGPDAVANFELRSGPQTIAGLIYYEVGAREDAVLNTGKLANLSSLAMVTAEQRMISGLVIDEQHRRVLIRAVGPTLREFGVSNPVANPYLTLHHGTMPIYYNDDWGTRHDAAEIAAVAARVGAPPLPAGSKDAALLVDLPPGIYSAHATLASGAGGVAMIEVFSVPE
jgi:hypothetical protein